MHEGTVTLAADPRSALVKYVTEVLVEESDFYSRAAARAYYFWLVTSDRVEGRNAEQNWTAESKGTERFKETSSLI